MEIRILLADDHQVLIDGFKSIFERVDDIRVVGAANNGKEVLDFLSQKTVDVVLLDINMPVLNGVETCKRITKKYPEVKVIAVSMFDQQSYFKRMIQHGAMGYLLKDDSADEITHAIHTVMAGDRYVSTQLQDRLSSIDFLTRTNKAIFNVSPREKEVLELLSQGLTDQKIAEQLFISFHTVKTHRKNLLLKFDAKNGAELIKKALEKGHI